MKSLVLALACLLAAPSAFPAQRKRDRELPPTFVRSWRYETAELTNFKVATDGGIIAVSLADGRLIALSPVDGALQWSVDLGGEISVAPIVTSNAVLVSTARTGVAAEGVLRALDRATGLVLWTREMAKPATSDLVEYDGRVFYGSGDGSVYAVQLENGNASWAFPTRAPVRGQIALIGHELLVGSDDGALYALDRDTGTASWRFQTGGPVVGRAVVSARRVFVTSGDGSVYAIDLATQRVVWRARTGAAIEAGAFIVDEARIVVASFDNFVYLLDAHTGDRMWKRRMNGRLVSEPLADTPERILVSPLRDDRLTVLGLRAGEKISAFPLDQGDELVAPPTLAGPLLLIPTDTGLIAARSVRVDAPQTAVSR